MNQFWASVFYAVLGICLLLGAWAWLLLFIRKGPRALLGYEKVVLNQFENAAVYKDGHFERILEPGVHWVQSSNRRLTLVDVRPEVYRIDQTCVTSDHFTAAVRYVARVRIRDPRAAISISQNHKEEVAARL